jgi:hypothetical protein
MQGHFSDAIGSKFFYTVSLTKKRESGKGHPNPNSGKALIPEKTDCRE